MCEECRAAVCPERCPFHRRSHAACTLCGEGVGEGGYHGKGCHVCARCADYLTAGDILLLAGLSEIGELLSLFGFERAVS